MAVVVAACACLAVWRRCPCRCQSTCLRCAYCECCTCDACSTCHGGWTFFAACFCWSQRLRCRRSGAWFCPICLVFPVWRVTWLHGCIRRACVTAIGAPATINVIARWVLLCDSQCSHNALVMFVGKAAPWHWGELLPWPPLLHSRCLSCKALAPLVENNVTSACWDRRQWRHCLSLLVATVPSSNAYVSFMARFC